MSTFAREHANCPSYEQLVTCKRDDCSSVTRLCFITTLSFLFTSRLTIGRRDTAAYNEDWTVETQRNETKTRGEMGHGGQG